MKGKIRLTLEADGWAVENLNAGGRRVRGPAWKVLKNGEKVGCGWTEVDAWLLALELNHNEASNQNDASSEPQAVRDLFGGFDLMPDDPGHVKHWEERGYRCHVFKMPSTFGQYSWGITEVRTGQGVGGFSETFEKAIEDAQAAIDEQTARSMKP